MIILRVTAYMGRAPSRAAAASFGPEGGVIGRSPDCTLVLDDPSKHVSKRQARVDFAAGQYRLTCISAANPLFVNGRELAMDESVTLSIGDSIMIAGFQLVCEAAGAGSPAVHAKGAVAPPPSSAGPPDLFADLVAPRPGARSTPARSPAAASFDPFAELSPPDAPPAPRPLPGASPPGWAPAPNPLPTPRADRPASSTAPTPTPASGRDDPLAMFGDSRPGASDPLGILGDVGPTPAHPIPAGPRWSLETDRDDSNAPAPSGKGSTPALGGLGIEPAARPAESLDALFDLRSATDPLGPGSPLQGAPDRQRADVKENDPVASLGGTPYAAPPAPLADRGGALQGTFRLPSADIASSASRAQSSSPSSGRAPPAPPPTANPASLVRAGAVLSWDAQTPKATALPPLSAEQVRSIGEQISDQRPAQFQPPPNTRPTSFIEDLNAAQLNALRASQPSRPATPEGPRIEGSQTELLRSLLAGLGMSELPAAGGARGTNRALTPELMRRIGELLRVSSQGTVELLQARAMLKREMRTDVTLIAASDNNPLKFSPDAPAALAHLLSAQPVRGFLEPAAAMRDAYDDLLAHQVAFVAGVRAALGALIQRFDPEGLEERLSGRSMLDSLLPMARKAKLWELFGELFAEISAEAQDDFDALFGRAFVQAYEEQTARLKAGAEPGTSGARGTQDGGARGPGQESW